MNLHPFAQIRKELGYTQRDVSVLARITEQTVLKTEQGLYSMPPPSIIRVLCDALNDPRVTETQLYLRYQDWQVQHRKESSRVLKDAIVNFYHAEVGTNSTHEAFRSTVAGSQIGYCKLLCIPPSQLMMYERRGGELPEFLLTVFREMGVGEEWVKKLSSVIR